MKKLTMIVLLPLITGCVSSVKDVGMPYIDLHNWSGHRTLGIDTETGYFKHSSGLEIRFSFYGHRDLSGSQTPQGYPINYICINGEEVLIVETNSNVHFEFPGIDNRKMYFIKSTTEKDWYLIGIVLFYKNELIEMLNHE